MGQIFGESVAVVWITLIWQKVVAAMHINGYKPILALFKFGKLTKNRQTAKLNHCQINRAYVRNVHMYSRYTL